MTDPITPPPELVQQWKRTAPHPINEREHYHYITLCAAQWGADMELEACCEWFSADVVSEVIDVVSALRATRRPKPPSLKEQALNAMSHADKDALTNPLTGEVVALRTILSKEQSDTIRLALEALDA